jgi:hypothetical protein
MGAVNRSATRQQQTYLAASRGHVARRKIVRSAADVVENRQKTENFSRFFCAMSR